MAADTLTRTKGLHPLLLGWHTGGPLSALSLTGREEAPVCRHNSGNGNDVGPSSRDDMRQAFCCAFFHNGTPLTSHFLGCHREVLMRRLHNLDRAALLFGDCFATAANPVEQKVRFAVRPLQLKIGPDGTCCAGLVANASFFGGGGWNECPMCVC